MKMKTQFQKLRIPPYRLLLLLVPLILGACSTGIAGTVQDPWSTPQVTIPSLTVPTENSISGTAQTPAIFNAPGDQSTQSPVVVSTSNPLQSATVPQPSPTRLAPGDWMTLPVIPTVSQVARQIYQRGLELGNDPHAFSKIGDCQSITTYFLGYYDLPGYYDLGPYSSLQATIDWYAGSFKRESLAVKGGFNAAAILSPLRADPRQCRSNENPVSCEIHFHHPSLAIISLEEWWAGHPENYEKYMRQIIEYVISQGVVPIIATKADNLEGNNLINETIANLAQEYDIPLWNFWASVQDLPNHGLAAYDPFGEVDMFHLTHGHNFIFSSDPSFERSGWSMRNLTALQALDAVQRALTEQP